MSEPLGTGWGAAKPVRARWSVSGIWPIDYVQLAEREKHEQNVAVWEYEPSGYVGQGDIVLGDPIPDLEFEQQKEAFNSIPPLTLLPYRGQFVASRNGEIVDSGDNLAALTRRFFGEHGDVPVYITKVGEPIRITISTPLFR